MAITNQPAPPEQAEQNKRRKRKSGLILIDDEKDLSEFLKARADDNLPAEEILRRRRSFARAEALQWRSRAGNASTQTAGEAPPARIIDVDSALATAAKPSPQHVDAPAAAVLEIPLVRLQMVRDKTLPYAGEYLDETFKVYTLFKRIVGESPVEHVLVFCVDTKNRLTHVQVLSIGTIENALVGPAEVIKIALLSNASSVLLAHNHPSGEIEPSQEDIEITRRLQRALMIVGLKLLDHVIVGDERCYSFTEQKEIELPGTAHFGRRAAPKNTAQELKQGYSDEQIEYVRGMIGQLQTAAFKRPRRHFFSVRSLALRLGYALEGAAELSIDPLAEPPRIRYQLGRDYVKSIWIGLIQSEIARRWERTETLQRIEQGVIWIDDAAARWIALALLKEFYPR